MSAEKLASIGCSVLTPKVFDVLPEQEPGSGEKIQLTVSINTVYTKRKVLSEECMLSGLTVV